jgi:hypothetical protein
MSELYRRAMQDFLSGWLRRSPPFHQASFGFCVFLHLAACMLVLVAFSFVAQLARTACMRLCFFYPS